MSEGWAAENRLSPLAQAVLHQLLDRLERSRAQAQGGAADGPSRPARRIQVRMTDEVVPGYLAGTLDPAARRALHADLARLEADGVIALRWVKFEEGNLLERVYLTPDGMATAYRLLGRRPVRDVLAEVAGELMAWRASLPHALPPGWSWVDRWLEEVLPALRAGRAPAHGMPGGVAEVRRLLAVLSGLMQQGGTPVPVRVFSKRCLGDSKAFERYVKARLVSLVRRYALPVWGVAPEAYADDAVLLRELGLEVTHDLIAFCGPLRFRLRAGPVVDAGAFPAGLALDAADVAELMVVDLPVRRVITIENKANYREYVRRERRADEVVVFLGGFASPGQREFLRRLRAAWQHGTPCLLHWGDLDYGGILILQHLRDTCWPDAQPWRMEPGLLAAYADLLEPFDAAYRRRLEGLRADPRYAWAHPLLDALLSRGGTLEQEALLT